MRCVDCKFHKAFPTTNIHWCEATKKHKRISDEDAHVDAPCKVADRKTEPQTEVDWKQRLCDMYGTDRKSFDEAWQKYEADKVEDKPYAERDGM